MNEEIEIKLDVLGMMLAFEQGELDDKETIEFFQEILSSGLVWQLQGFYGRTAKALIELGLIK